MIGVVMVGSGDGGELVVIGWRKCKEECSFTH